MWQTWNEGGGVWACCLRGRAISQKDDQSQILFTRETSNAASPPKSEYSVLFQSQENSRAHTRSLKGSRKWLSGSLTWNVLHSTTLDANYATLKVFLCIVSYALFHDVPCILKVPTGFLRGCEAEEGYRFAQPQGPDMGRFRNLSECVTVKTRCHER